MGTLRIAVLLVAALLAACGRSQAVEKSDATGPFMAGPALWDDPQNTPHPAFGWPTLSSPPLGALPDFWAPPPARVLPQPVAGLEHVAHADDVPSGGGIAAFGSLVVVPGYGDESAVVDIGDPARPRRIARFNHGNDSPFGSDPEKHGGLLGFLALAHRGAATIAYPSGRLVAVFATDSVIDSWDLTDPREPRQLPSLPTSQSHKVGVVPGTPIVYNAASGGGGSGGQVGEGTGVTEIYDLSDPDHPVHVQDFPNGYSCHHIFFWNRPEQNKYRAICAGVEQTQLWDTTDPRQPQVIVTMPMPLGVPGAPSAAVTPIHFSHTAGLNRDGTVLYVGDENGGGGVPPGCTVSVATPEGDVSLPVGALWFYDVSVETSPMLLGWYSAMNDPLVKSATASCTAHHGRLVPDPQRDLLAMSFYGDGVILVDFTNPLLPHAVDQFADGSYTWETWYHNGWLVTGDLSRGLDVLTFR